MWPIEKYIKTRRNETEEIRRFLKIEISFLLFESKSAFIEESVLLEEFVLSEKLSSDQLHEEQWCIKGYVSDLRCR